MKRIQWLFLLGTIFWLLTPCPLAAQEGPEITKININMGKEPWEKPEATPSTRNFDPKDLEGLLEELLSYNPELQAVIEKIKSLENRIDPAGSLDDPRFSFEGSNIPISPPALNRTPMTGLQIYYRQKVPWPGKLKLKKRIAKSKTEQEKEEYYERLNQLVSKFKETYYEYRMTSELLKIYSSTISRLRGLGLILEARYSAGDTPQQDILINQVEISNLDETVVELKQRHKILLARMNTLLNRPGETILKIKSGRDPFTQIKVPLKDLLDVAERYRPWLKKSALQIQQAEYEHKLTKKGLLPDFDFGGGWRFRQGSPGDPVGGEDFFSAGFSMNLPIYAGKKQKKEIAAAYHQKRVQEHLKQATKQEVLFQVEQAFHQLNQLKSQLNILKSRTLPQARAAVESSQINYQADEIDFLNVLTNEVALLNQRLKQTQYYYEHEKKIAEMEMATGLPIHSLNELPNKEVSHDKYPEDI